MASSYKSSKAQSIAKNKNWKREDVGKPRGQSPKTKTKLNKTYNVGELDLEPEPDVDYVSPHNQAFLHEQPDDQPPESGLPVPRAARHYLYGQHSWCEQSRAGDKSGALRQQERCGAEGEGVPEFNWRGGPYREHNTRASARRHEQRKPDLASPDPEEYLSPTVMQQIADEWLQRHGWPLLQDEYAPNYEQYGLLDSSANFERGAHEAPHSSENDLSDESDDLPSDESLRLLTLHQLEQSIQVYQSALSLLLGECRIREKLKSNSRLFLPIPFEEFPTRDTDQPPEFVLSGSHRLSGTPSGPHASGRGRGRLQGDRVIGNGKGRHRR